MAVKVNKDECVGCSVCVDICPQSAIKVDGVAIIDADLCVDCGACVDECPNNALSQE